MNNEMNDASPHREGSVMATIEETISRVGHAIVSTFTGEGDQAPYSYSVGLEEKGVSNLLMIGFHHNLMHTLVNDVAKALCDENDEGKLVTETRRMSNIVKGYDVLLVPVAEEDAKQFAFVLNARTDGPLNLVQIVLPDENGEFTAPTSKLAAGQDISRLLNT